MQTLVNGCRINDRKAQEQLYKKFYGAMAAVCARYTRNGQDTKEVLNDGFLKVFKNIHQYDPMKASLYTWIKTIVINASIDFLRRQQPFHASLTADTCQEPEIENAVIERINAEALMAVITQLPPATLLVFNLYTIEGYNHREIAQLLRISEGTSKWHLSDARKRLKQSLQTQCL